MNKLLKTIIFIAYTFVIFLVAMLIINFTTGSRKFSEYTTTPYNDDITVNVQMLENRESNRVNKDKNEYSYYDLRLFVRKKENKAMQNIYAYACVESEGGYKYIQTTSAKTMGDGTWYNRTMYLLNSSTKFAYNQVVTDEDGNKTHENFIPKTVYLKISYEIENDNDVFETRSLNYMFNYEEIKQNDYKDYEKRNVNEKDIAYANDVFKIKLTHQVEKTPEDKNKTKKNVDKLVISNLEAVGANLPKNVSIENIDLAVEGVIENEEMITEGFSKYVRFFTYSGALMTSIPVNATRDISFDNKYQISKLYFTANILLSNGEKVTTKYYVDMKDVFLEEYTA